VSNRRTHIDRNTLLTLFQANVNKSVYQEGCKNQQENIQRYAVTVTAAGPWIRRHDDVEVSHILASQCQSYSSNGVITRVTFWGVTVSHFHNDRQRLVF